MRDILFGEAQVNFVQCQSLMIEFGHYIDHNTDFIQHGTDAGQQLGSEWS